ncbi:MAG: acyl-CoA reductase [Flavobacteriaceae bacterium]|nr:acyl-CoA reductase [Flavobacteriaceae bacterium]
MTIEDRIISFSNLGVAINNFLDHSKSTTHKESDYSSWNACLQLAESKNGWFTKQQVYIALRSWAKLLQKDKLQRWSEHYKMDRIQSPKKVLIIMAGNIPLVGMHDLLSVLITGHHAVVKLSSSDGILLPFLFDRLVEIEPKWKTYVSFSKEHGKHFDAVIATGSNNTARYFEQYFANKPNIIRKNRNSVAIIDGTESKEELQALGKDIFTYFGLGCRSVSKLYVPKDYNFDNFYRAILAPHQDVLKMEKYTNNYDYNKAVYLMSEFNFLDNGFLMVKEESSFGSPIATVFYETYQNLPQLEDRLRSQEAEIQCIVQKSMTTKRVAFGQTQQPQLMDYADGVDTVAFLLKI